MCISENCTTEICRSQGLGVILKWFYRSQQYSQRWYSIWRRTQWKRSSVFMVFRYRFDNIQFNSNYNQKSWFGWKTWRRWFGYNRRWIRSQWCVIITFKCFSPHISTRLQIHKKAAFFSWALAQVIIGKIYCNPFYYILDLIRLSKRQKMSGGVSRPPK